MPGWPLSEALERRRSRRAPQGWGAQPWARERGRWSDWAQREWWRLCQAGLDREPRAATYARRALEALAHANYLGGSYTAWDLWRFFSDAAFRAKLTDACDDADTRRIFSRGGPFMRLSGSELHRILVALRAALRQTHPHLG